MSKTCLSLGLIHVAQADAADNSCNNPLKPCQKSTQLLTTSSVTLACLASQHLLRVKPVNSVLCACMKPWLLIKLTPKGVVFSFFSFLLCKCMKACAWVVQVVLQSLEIYNDVQCSAVPALTAQHLAAEAQADAEVCMHKLITNLATEVKFCMHQPYAVLFHKDQDKVCMH